MKKFDITFITVVLNGRLHVNKYIECVKEGFYCGHKFICIDGNSNDGTKEILFGKKKYFEYIISENDEGFYHALNKAIKKVKTTYYLVFGIDDVVNFKKIQKYLKIAKIDQNVLVCGSVLLNGKKIKKPNENRWIADFLGWGSIISHHSVGTIIATRLHKKYGNYSYNFPLLADGFFIQQVIKNKDPIYLTNAVFGHFFLGGMSSKNLERSACEKFLIMMKLYDSFWIQSILLNIRLFTSKFRV
jgi:glycosyltransferase involved in cell wall biosynthesis